ncbi:MAG: hypothetical protein ACO377_11025, partial [Pseudomonadales bacterium]
MNLDTSQVLRRDVHTLRRLARQNPEAYAALHAESVAALAARNLLKPKIEYPDALPVSAHVGEIARLL